MPQSAATAHTDILARICEKPKGTVFFSLKHTCKTHKSAFWGKCQKLHQVSLSNCLLCISTWMSKRQLKLEMSRTFLLTGCLTQAYWFPSVLCLNERHQRPSGFPVIYYKTTFFSSLTAFSPSLLSKAPGFLSFSFFHWIIACYASSNQTAPPSPHLSARLWPFSQT